MGIYDYIIVGGGISGLYMAYQLSKTIIVIPCLYKEGFALTFFPSEAKPMFCLTDSKSVLDHIGRIWLPALLAWTVCAADHDQSRISLGFQPKTTAA